MMANVGHEQADAQAAKEALITSLIDALKKNRKALCFLPEMMEELIEIQGIKAQDETISNTSKGNRSWTMEGVIEDLRERNNELIREIKNKEERISELERKLSSMKETAEKEEKQSDTNDNITRCRDEHNNANTNSTEEERRREREKQYMSALGDKEKEIQELKESLRHAEEERTSLECHKDTEIGKLKSRIASLSEKRVKQDQSKVEDTLSMNRQSKIEEEYKNFFDDARIDACEAIQSFLRLQKEIDIYIYSPRLACLIFETAFKLMEEAKKAATEFCKDVSRDMIKSATFMSRQFMLGKKNQTSFQVTFKRSCKGQEELPYTRDMLDAVMLALKETAQNCDLDMFVKDVEEISFQKWQNWYEVEGLNGFRPSFTLLKHEKIISYMKKCLRLTWRMVTQVPTLSIEYNSQYLNKNHKKLGYHTHPDMQSTSAEQAPGEEIACYLWPGLLDGNGRLIRTGEVLCKTPKRTLTSWHPF